MKEHKLNDYINKVILDINDINGDGKYNVNDFLDMTNEDILKENGGKKFDVVLMNPPYDRGLGNKFLKKVIEISNKVISIQPLAYLLNKKQIKDITEVIDKYGADIEQLNAKEFDGLNLMQQIGIIYINKLKKSDILYNGKKYDKSSDINMFSNDEYLTEFNKIISNLLEDNLDNHLKSIPEAIHCKNKNENNPNENWYCIRIGWIRGHISEKTNLVNDDYYTIVSNSKKELEKIKGQYKDLIKFKDTKSSLNKNKDKKVLQYYFAFNTENEMNNFYNYLRSDFCRTCYRLVKNGTNVFGGGEFKYIPWFDFSNDHFSKSPREIDDWLFKKYNISDKIRKHIEEILPDYYGIRK